MKKLNHKEQIFLLEYFIDFDVERSAIAAGYSKSLAHTKAYQWVTDSPKNPKPYLREAIEQKMKEREEKTEITIDKIEEELSIIAFGKPTSELSPSEKLKALELLGKRRGMFKESVEITGGPIASTQIMIVIPENQRDLIQDITRDQITHGSE